MVTPVAVEPQRNRIGNAALVLTLISIGLPIAGFLTGVIAALAEGAQGDAVGWGILGGIVFGAVAAGIGSVFAIAGVVLGIVGLTRRNRRKFTSVLAIGLGIVPAIGVLALPASIDTFF